METGTTPRLLANALHIVRPATIPRGTPITIPTRANVVDCQTTAEATWRFTNPSTFRSPISRRRRDTLTTSRCVSVAAPNTANIAPKMSGKLTASPKLMRDVGMMAGVAIDEYESR
jgi:hypothetical protein